jgi:hypothetical protein
MDERVEDIEDTCMCPGCEARMDRPVGAKRWYCSIECACYAGAYSVTKGWLPERKDGDGEPRVRDDTQEADDGQA